MPVSVTKYVQIERPVADAYTFLADPATMPKWAIHNVRSIKPVGNGRWEMDTPRGRASGRSRPALFRLQTPLRSI